MMTTDMEKPVPETLLDLKQRDYVLYTGGDIKYENELKTWIKEEER